MHGERGGQRERQTTEREKEGGAGEEWGQGRHGRQKDEDNARGERGTERKTDTEREIGGGGECVLGGVGEGGGGADIDLLKTERPRET